MVKLFQPRREPKYRSMHLVKALNAATDGNDFHATSVAVEGRVEDRIHFGQSEPLFIVRYRIGEPMRIYDARTERKLWTGSETDFLHQIDKIAARLTLSLGDL